jgi:hypothetical protein
MSDLRIDLFIGSISEMGLRVFVRYFDTAVRYGATGAAFSAERRRGCISQFSSLYFFCSLSSEKHFILFRIPIVATMCSHIVRPLYFVAV